MSVRVTLDDAAAQALMARLAEIVARPRSALTQSSQALRRLVQDTFRDERDPWGRAWTRHAPATRAARDRVNAAGNILIDTGRMYGTVDAVADDDGVAVSVTAPYAGYHQFGNPGHRAFGGPVSPLPQRAFLPIPAEGLAPTVPASWWYEILFPVQSALDRARAGA